MHLSSRDAKASGSVQIRGTAGVAGSDSHENGRWGVFERRGLEKGKLPFPRGFFPSSLLPFFFWVASYYILVLFVGLQRPGGGKQSGPDWSAGNVLNSLPTYIPHSPIVPRDDDGKKKFVSSQKKRKFSTVFCMHLKRQCSGVLIFLWCWSFLNTILHPLLSLPSQIYFILFYTPPPPLVCLFFSYSPWIGIIIFYRSSKKPLLFSLLGGGGGVMRRSLPSSVFFLPSLVTPVWTPEVCLVLIFF